MHSAIRLARPTRLPAPSLAALLARIATMARIASERRRLAMLDPHQLADCGISLDAAAREAARPAWDIPHNRLRP